MVNVLILRTVLAIGDEAGYRDDGDFRKREVVEGVE